MSDASPAPRRRRRIVLALVGALGLLLTLVALLGPSIAASALRDPVAAAVGERLGGAATLEDLSLSWGGHVGASGLALADGAGRRVLAVERLDARVALLPALLGKGFQGRARVDGFEAVLREDADGGWVLTERRAEPEPGPGAPAGSEPAPSEEPLPRLDLALELRDGRVVLEGAERTQTLDDVAVEAELEAQAGALASLEEALAAGALRAHAQVGRLRLDSAALVAEGRASADLESGRATLEVDLDANDGRLGLEAALALDERAETPSTLSLRSHDVRATAAMAPVLARLHPLLAGVEGLAQGALAGRVQCALELSYGAPLVPLLAAGGWSALDPTALDARGTFGLDGAVLEGNELLGAAIALLGGDPAAPVDLEPVRLRVDAGRLRYEDPWTWKVAGARTTFTGSIGIDGSLDLAWNVPIDERLAQRQHLPRELVGRTLTVPLGGTLRHPRLDLGGALEALAGEAAQGALEDALRGELEKLEEKLQERVGDELRQRVDLGRVLGLPKKKTPPSSGDGDGR